MSSKCDFGPVEIWLGVVTIFTFIGLGFLISAIGANGSLFGAVASPGLMGAAGGAAGMAAFFCLLALSKLNDFRNCMWKSCSSESTNLRNMIIILLGVLTAIVAECATVAIFAWVPWIPIPFMIAIVVSFGAAIGLLWKISELSGKLSICKNSSDMQVGIDELRTATNEMKISMDEIRKSIDSLKSTNTFSIKDVDP